MGHGYPIHLGRVDRIPKYGMATIDPPKLTRYLLDPENGKGKAAFFEAIGYTKENADQLDRDMRNGLRENGGDARIKSKAGEIVYNVVMDLGVEKKVRVMTVWQVDHEGEPPRFITAFPDEKKKKR